MKKMNMRKKITAALIAANGISAMSNGDLSAMENVKTMRDFTLPLSKHVKYSEGEPSGLEKAWFDIDSLKTQTELEEYLNNHRTDIFYAMHQGDAARTAANEKLAKTQAHLIHSALTIQRKWRDSLKRTHPKYQLMPDTETMRKKIKSLKKKYPATATASVQLSNGTVKELKPLSKDFINVMSMNVKEGPERNWASLGRGVLHDNPDTRRYHGMETELKRAERGTVNCTIWAELINWFLHENGYPCTLISCDRHRFVVAPVRTADNSKIRLCRIGVSEDEPSLDQAKIGVHSFCKTSLKNKMWDWVMFPQSSGHHESIYDSSRFSPTMVYSKGIHSNYFQYNIPAAKMTPWIQGLKETFQYWAKKGEIKTDVTNRQRTYNFKLIPRDAEYLYVPVNIEYLDGALDGTIRSENAIYKSELAEKHQLPNKQTPLLYAKYKMPNRKTPDWTNGTLTISIKPKQDRFAEATISYEDKSTKKQKTETLNGGYIFGIPYGETAVAFWNDPKYKDLEEIKPSKEKKDV